MSFDLPPVRYLAAVHIPLLQGELPAVALVRSDASSSRLVKLTEVRGRMFHDHIMGYLAELADKLVAIDQATSIAVHLAVSGAALSGADVAGLLAGKWPDESWSFVRLAGTSDLPQIDDSDERLPLNQFKLPRMAIVNTINYAYNDPGRIYFSIAEDEGRRLESQLSKFTERAATVPANDPDAILEYEGESLVIATGVAIWHHLHSKSVRAGMAREKLTQQGMRI